MGTEASPRPAAGTEGDRGAAARLAGRPGYLLGPGDVPTELLRAPCHLEVMIPARDEARRLPHTMLRTIRYLEAQPYSSSLVVVDNGSVDRTVDLVTRLRSHSGRVTVSVIGCAEPGKGAAVRRGILTSRARYLGYMDADLATPIESLEMAVPLLESGYQAVVGSRRIGGATYAEQQPRRRVLGGLVFRAVAHRLLPGVVDTQCGFKFFDGDLARAVARSLRVEGFAFDVELLRTITAMGVPVKEIPVVWSDEEGSTLRGLRDGARAVGDLLHLAGHRDARRRGAALCPRLPSSPAAGCSSSTGATWRTRRPAAPRPTPTRSPPGSPRPGPASPFSPRGSARPPPTARHALTW